MRNETNVEEHLEWLKVHCQRYTDDQRDVTIGQMMMLLWVLGDTPANAQGKAEVFWDTSRERRQD